MKKMKQILSTDQIVLHHLMAMEAMDFMGIGMIPTDQGDKDLKTIDGTMVDNILRAMVAKITGLEVKEEEVTGDTIMKMDTIPIGWMSRVQVMVFESSMNSGTGT